MAWEHQFDLEALERGERLEALVCRRVEHPRHDLGAEPPGQRVPRTQLIADKQDAMTLEKERAVTRRVTRRGDHARAPWDVQYFVARERLGILNLARLGRAARVIPTKKRQMPGRQISPSSLTGLASPSAGRDDAWLA